MYLTSLSFTFIVGKMGTQTLTCVFVMRIQREYMWRTEHVLTNNLCSIQAHSLWLLGKRKCKVTDQSGDAVTYHWLGQSLLVYLHPPPWRASCCLSGGSFLQQHDLLYLVPVGVQGEGSGGETVESVMEVRTRRKGACNIFPNSSKGWQLGHILYNDSEASWRGVFFEWDTLEIATQIRDYNASSHVDASSQW